MTSIVERPVISGRRARVAERALPHLPVTTTHDPTGGGRPRLVLPAGQGWGRVIHDLAPVSSVGSGEEALIRLPGLSGVQAQVRRDEHADHERPYGGRIGGELGRQRPQSRAHLRSGPGDAA